jgi:hypothetical protein
MFENENDQQADFEKISVSVVAPTPVTPIPGPAHPFPVEEDFTDNVDTDGDSDVETEKEWFDEAQLTELTQRFPSKVSEAMVNEVRPFFFFGTWDFKTYIYRGHRGRIHPICPQPPKEVVRHPQVSVFCPRGRAARASALPP